MSWLKGKPMRAPESPAHVSLEQLMGVVAQLEAAGIATPAGSYVKATAPKLELDKWGMPLPLSASDQDRLDRLFAIVSEPYDRAQALLHSGLLAPDEIQALQAAYPEIYESLMKEAFRELMETPPPYARWAEETLNVLYGIPASTVRSTGQLPQQQPKTGSVNISPGETGTPADRREVAVREQKEQR